MAFFTRNRVSGGSWGASGIYKKTYERWGDYDVFTRGGDLMAHMARAASVGDWESALFRTKLICAILYDNLRAHCDGSYTWINGEWRRITSFDERHISSMEAACEMAIRFYTPEDEEGKLTRCNLKWGAFFPHQGVRWGRLVRRHDSKGRTPRRQNN